MTLIKFWENENKNTKVSIKVWKTQSIKLLMLDSIIISSKLILDLLTNGIYNKEINYIDS